MLFVDASVIVAILTNETDADELMARLETAIADNRQLYVSPVVRVEAALSITRRLAGKDKPATKEMLARARAMVDQFILDLEAKDTMITADVASKALDAAQQFGKIVNHPASLNMGDCFAYACARAYRTKIAYKGEDFTHTDLGW
ncbi:type II toxin-antitoxin system VapC family toxin [Pararhizobium haloflavum]|uniref:type II toxin-antitoxin system VapC family toxin n=1 Tax=Pararhizobium haloflavum TaxID=2037914 RepID=UPI000C173C4F|nr:type II toxin-antitoxin system VapC family toxin [Pararhizobium haloflavum]